MCAYRRPRRAAAAGDAIPFASNGELHLFYLSSPLGTTEYPERVRTTWQHARSADLVTWEELPPAVEPGPEGAVDGGGIWTGSVVERDGIFYLFYTGHHVGAPNPQTICLATSSDLVTFTKYEGNPVLLPMPDCEPVDWRDPYVFYNEQEQRWWMLIAARAAKGPHWRRGVIKLATSEDLLHWEVEDDPLYSPGTTYCPECPELWESGGRWYLVYSAFSENVGTVYRVADAPRGPFRTPRAAELGGRRWYAAKSAPYGDKRAFFGWVHDRIEVGGDSRWLWGGDFALPRLVAPTGPDGALEVRPAPGVLAEFGEPVPAGSGRVGAPGLIGYLPGPLVTSGQALIELRATKLDAAEVGLALAVDEAGAGWRVTVEPRRDRVELSREPRPLDDFWADLTARTGDYREVDGPVFAWADLPGGTDALRIQLVLDAGLMEVYVNDQVALTQRISADESLRVSAFVADGAAELALAVAAPAW